MWYGTTHDGNGVFADVLKPDVFKVASPKTVHALLLVLADDDVPQGRAGLQEKDGIGVSWSCAANFSTITTSKGQLGVHRPPSPSPQAPEPRSYLTHPASNTWPAEIRIGAERLFESVGVGTPPS